MKQAEAERSKDRVFGLPAKEQSTQPPTMLAGMSNRVGPGRRLRGLMPQTAMLHTLRCLDSFSGRRRLTARGQLESLFLEHAGQTLAGDLGYTAKGVFHSNTIDYGPRFRDAGEDLCAACNGNFDDSTYLLGVRPPSPRRGRGKVRLLLRRAAGESLPVAELAKSSDAT